MSNPILNEKFAESEIVLQSAPMTVNGTLQIAAFLGLILLAAAYIVWSKFSMGYTDFANTLTMAGGIIGFVLALVVCFTRNKYLIPVYAACEGLFLGGISAFFEARYPGIVLQAVTGTFCAFFSMLLLYRFNIIRCSDKFKSVIFISTLSIASIYLIDWIGHFFGLSIPVINTSSTFGIGFSLIVVAIAALNLIVDFDFIEQGARNLLPKDMEWYGAFGLMVTLVWLYIEILKLLAKFSDRK